MSQSALARPRIHKVNNDTNFYFNFKCLILRFSCKQRKYFVFYVSMKRLKADQKLGPHT